MSLFGPLLFVEVPLVNLSRPRRLPALTYLCTLLAGACQEPPTTGTLTVNVTGLPTGALGAIRIVGPNQFFQMVRTTQTLENLVPGDYIINRDPIVHSLVRYAVPVIRDTITVVRGQAATVDAAYAVTTGALTLTINGLPASTAAAVVVKGPLDSITPIFNEGVFETRTVMTLATGRYEITADTTFTSLGDKFATSKRKDTVLVGASLTPVGKTVDYTLASGTLDVTVTGLPSTYAGRPVTITGPNDYIVQTAQTRSLHGLVAGTYSIVADNVGNTCPNTYSTTNTSQSVDVAIGATATASVAYTAQAIDPASLNLRVEKVYLTQATQNPEGSVPMLSGKPALLRVFGLANQCNSAKPQVRVTIAGGAPVLLTAQEDSVRTVGDDWVPAASWNYLLDASIVQPGLTVQAEIDPANQVAEANEGDNTRTVTPDIRSGPVLALRFVPIHQSAISLTGNVNAGNADAFLEWPRKLYPVGTFEFDLRDPYTTSRTLDPCRDVGTTGQCPSWAGLISELSAVRTADQSNRYYYGVVRLNYTPGVYGIAGGIPSSVAMGWDALNSGFGSSASEAMAHELGHSFGRRHAPCGPVGGPDPAYPYTGGRIGVLGWHPTEGFKHPGDFGDIMGYCSTQWVSDYTYLGVWDRIQGNPGSVAAVADAESSSLLVWGTIADGQVSLEPAFEISSTARMPAPGPHRISLLDDRGAEITSISFSAERIVDLPGDAESFAFTIPLSALGGRTVSSLRVTAYGRTVTAIASGDVAADPRAVVTRAGGRAARIQWDASRFPVVMVRDPVNGQVLSFARGGDATIVTSTTQLDLNFSNRVRSTRRLREFR